MQNYHYLIKTKTGARTDAQLARLAAACGLTNFWRRSSSVTPRAEVPPAAMKSNPKQISAINSEQIQR
jgi:hypothetical protein